MVESSATVPKLPNNQGVLSSSALGEPFARTMMAKPYRTFATAAVANIDTDRPSQLPRFLFFRICDTREPR